MKYFKRLLIHYCKWTIVIAVTAILVLLMFAGAIVAFVNGCEDSPTWFLLYLTAPLPIALLRMVWEWTETFDPWL